MTTATSTDMQEELQRRENDFKKQNGEVGKMLWSILQGPFVNWLNDRGYFAEGGDDDDLGRPIRPFPSMKADFDGLSLTIRHGSDTGTICMNTVEGRYVKLRHVVINVFFPEDDGRESFGFKALIDEADGGEYDIFSCMVDHYGQMTEAYCDFEPDDCRDAILRDDWDKFRKWLLTAFTAHKLGDLKVTNVR